MQSAPQPEPQDDAVAAWRVERLREAGFSLEQAKHVAGRRTYDLHALLELIDRGCSPELAVRILTPIEEEGPRW